MTTPPPTPTTTKPVRFNVESAAAGLLRFTYVDDEATGITTYTVTGPRISGSLTTQPAPDPGPVLDPETPKLCVTLGSGDRDWFYDVRDAPLIVNRVTLIGSSIINTDDDGDRWWMNMRRTNRHPDVPKATEARARAVVRAAVRHWLWRDDTAALKLRAVAIAAHDPWRRDRFNDKVGTAQRHVDDATARLSAARADLEAVDQQLTELAPHLPPPPTPGPDPEPVLRRRARKADAS